MNDELSIFISCSKQCEAPPFPFMHNIHVGAALAKKAFDGMLTDNCGDNISEKNPYYCELTAQYHAWKNCTSEHLGFFHSRRYMSFKGEVLVDKSFNGRRLPRAYTVEKLPSAVLLQGYGYEKANIDDIIHKYPIISVLPEKMPETAKERFIRTQSNGKHELELIETAISEHFPEYLPAYRNYINSNMLYFCNMFIMRRDCFYGYCEWLFSILSYVDERLAERLPRDDGMMGEQLFGVYMTYIKQSGKYEWAELPRIHFSEVGGASKNFSCSKIGNSLFPPGSVRRNIIRKILKG